MPEEPIADEGPIFTAAEWAEFFAAPVESIERRRPRWIRLIGALVAGAMLAGSAAFLIQQIAGRAQLQEPAEIRAHAIARTAESEWGWLVTNVVVVPIDAPRVGGRVTNNPPDGVVEIDLRPWNRNRLDRLMDHEMGHLLDFAVWASGSTDRRGGLETEAWAECAAVDAGTRRVDGQRADDRYHCRSEELDIYRSTVASLTEVCRPWSEPECRVVDPRRD